MMADYLMRSSFHLSPYVCISITLEMYIAWIFVFVFASFCDLPLYLHLYLSIFCKLVSFVFAFVSLEAPRALAIFLSVSRRSHFSHRHHHHDLAMIETGGDQDQGVEGSFQNKIHSYCMRSSFVLTITIMMIYSQHWWCRRWDWWWWAPGWWRPAGTARWSSTWWNWAGQNMAKIYFILKYDELILHWSVLVFLEP